MITKIKAFLLKYLDLILGGLTLAIAFILGHIIRIPGPVNKGEARHFENIDHFKAWYSYRFMGYWMLLSGDCDDRAEYIRRCALLDGFVLSLMLLCGGMLYWKDADGRSIEIRLSSVTEPHCGILALLETGEFYYLEHNTGEFCFIVNRD